jgi:hypothetical protein
LVLPETGKENNNDLAQMALWSFRSVQKPTLVFYFNMLTETSLQGYPLFFEKNFLKNQFFSVLKKWVHYHNRSVCPAVYMITFERIIRLSWNFLYCNISSISQSNSKVRTIRQGFIELQQEISLFSTISIKTMANSIFVKPRFRT